MNFRPFKRSGEYVLFLYYCLLRCNFLNKLMLSFKTSRKWIHRQLKQLISSWWNWELVQPESFHSHLFLMILLETASSKIRKRLFLIEKSSFIYYLKRKKDTRDKGRIKWEDLCIKELQNRNLIVTLQSHTTKCLINSFIGLLFKLFQTAYYNFYYKL